jgi:D-lactate dehydrogenase (cytochrome)
MEIGPMNKRYTEEQIIGFLREAGPGTVAVMRKIKQALDPKNIMNPGKVLAL